MSPSDRPKTHVSEQTNEEKSLAFDTLKVRAGYEPQEHQYATTVPIYESAAFGLESPERAQRIFAMEEAHATYSRTNNPTVEVFEKRIAALHGAPAAVALSTGMAAVSQTLMNVCGGNGRVVSIHQLYGGTLGGFKQIYPSLGIHFDVVDDLDDIAQYEALIGEDTKAIFVESLTNPFAQVLDIEALAQLAHRHNIPLIVDNTVATPYLLNPFDFGADIVVYSATKGLSGHGNALAGVVVESGHFDYGNGRFPQFTQAVWELRDAHGTERSVLDVAPQTPFCARIRSFLLNYLGATLSPFDAWLLLLGIDTLSERIDKQLSNTQAVLTYLEDNPHVAWICYPTARLSPYQSLAQKYLPRGAGAVLSFGFAGTEEQKNRFLRTVKIFNYQANIGDARSLIVDPVQSTHYELDPQQRRAAGLTPETIRLSLGLESPSDLLADLEQAFAFAFAD
jgi:O-acetylhomoserine (thiol)-lyase